MTHRVLDWMPWFAAEFWGSVRVLRLSEPACNLYRWMLDHQWLYGHVPDDAVVVSRLYPWGASALDSWREVRPLFDVKDGVLVNPKLAHVYACSLEMLSQKSAAGKASAMARLRKYGSAAPGRAVPTNTVQNDVRTPLEQRPNSTGTSELNVPVLSEPERTEPEPSKPKKRAPRAPAATPPSFVIPTPLATDDFRATWTLWQQYRREKKKPLTETGGVLQLDKLASMGPVRAIAALKHTMVMGWEGIREPDPSEHPGTFQAAPPPPRVDDAVRIRAEKAAARARMEAEQAAERARKESA